MKQAWCIACLDEKISGSEVVRWYVKRWGCEPHRDVKNFHFGMGLKMHIKNKDRRDRLFLIAAISIALLTLRAAGESLGLDRYLKANTVKHRTMPLFRQGCCYFNKLIKIPIEQARQLFIEFNKMLKEHKDLCEIVGVL